MQITKIVQISEMAIAKLVYLTQNGAKLFIVKEEKEPALTRRGCANFDTVS
jgi:hypothetical protein